MRQICPSLLILSLILLSFLPAKAGHKPPQVLLRIHVQTTGEGLSTTQATTITLPPNGEVIQIRAMPEVSEKNLVAIKPDASGAVYLYFDHQGKVNLDAVTGANQGRILVVMINGNVIYAPVIDEQISNGVFVIPHPIPAEVIQILQQTAEQNVKEAAR